jgi:hypothetical protein
MQHTYAEIFYRSKFKYSFRRARRFSASYLAKTFSGQQKIGQYVDQQMERVLRCVGEVIEFTTVCNKRRKTRDTQWLRTELSITQSTVLR